MNEDIGQILENWPFDPENSIRKVIDSSGVEKIQVRVDQGAFQGVLQMNLDGRPDGRRPHNSDFAFDHYRDSQQNVLETEGSLDEFQLSEEECQELFDECRRIYERYVFLLQIQDYDRVIRDTEQNMELFRFVNTYAERNEDQNNLEKWWPYIIRIHGVARVMVAMQNDDFETANEIIDDARDKIKALDKFDAEEFRIEKRRSIQALDDLEQELLSKRPLNLIDRLKKELGDAIDQEAFEKAAKLRDRIRELEELSVGDADDFNPGED
jgi:membrane-associated HD superfamily phosphohydrolase